MALSKRKHSSGASKRKIKKKREENSARDLQNHKSRGQRSQIAVVTEAEETRREGPCREADVSSEESDPKDTRTEETDSSDPKDTRTETPDGSGEESDPKDTRNQMAVVRNQTHKKTLGQSNRIAVTTTTPADAEAQFSLPTTPAGHYMIAEDQTIVSGSVLNVVDALMLMFAPYYCLNISYRSELGATLEFLQRCLFKINPEKGTKVERKE
ncbi:hypothetical protein NQZ68_013303 [Dissostichus eleginoides]|nr:hypothetical protein NQZ68_013303 [Dissostichus eleginoides]